MTNTQCHGTTLAGLAGGTEDPANNFTGVAPSAEFVIVKLKEAKENLKDYLCVPEDAVCYQENDIMFGIKYLVNKANSLRRPIVICLGLGSNQGGHNGLKSLADMITRIVRLSPSVLRLWQMHLPATALGTVMCGSRSVANHRTFQAL